MSYWLRSREWAGPGKQKELRREERGVCLSGAQEDALLLEKMKALEGEKEGEVSVLAGR